MPGIYPASIFQPITDPSVLKFAEDPQQSVAVILCIYRADRLSVSTICVYNIARI